MVWAFIIALVVLIIFAVWAGWVLWLDIILLAVNALILWMIALRSWAEIKEGKHYLYLIGAIASVISILLAGNYLPFWHVTTFAVITFAIVQVVIFVDYVIEKNKPKKHIHHGHLKRLHKAS